jgi:hypothetical protein
MGGGALATMFSPKWLRIAGTRSIDVQSWVRPLFWFLAELGRIGAAAQSIQGSGRLTATACFLRAAPGNIPDNPMTTRLRPQVLAGLAIIALLVAQSVEAQTTAAPRCGTGVHEEEAEGAVLFPQDQIFCSVLSDPKEARSFVTFLRGTFPSLDDPSGEGTNIASVGLGDSFGLVRWGGPSPGEGIQLDVVGSIFAQFDLGALSNDLINADYIIGVPLTFRRRGFSTRVRLYHQSSHLGDEYLLRAEDIERENLSFESLEFLLSQEMGPLRVYAGGERIFRREPGTLAAKLFHGGVELRTGRAGPVQLVGGLDLKTTERHDWSPAMSGRVGLEVARSGPGGHPARLISLLLEFYEGPSPYGQFFQDDISYVGVGLHFGL